MYQLICILLEHNRDLWGYGLFNFSDCTYIELIEEDVLQLCRERQIRNAIVELNDKSGVKFEQVKILDDLNLMPTFFIDHTSAYAKQSIYAVCTCRNNNIDGYLFLLSDGTLAFYTIAEVRRLIRTQTITNMRLKKYRRLRGKHPIPVGVPFKYIGEVSFS